MMTPTPMKTPRERREEIIAEKAAALPPVRSDPLLAFHIPADLADAFDDFVAVAVSRLDGISERASWSSDEREIVGWMEQRRWKANVQQT